MDTEPERRSDEGENEREDLLVTPAEHVVEVDKRHRESGDETTTETDKVRESGFDA